MNIFIVHHHLYTGGVTRVIDTQIKSLLKYTNHKLHLICGDFNGTDYQKVHLHHIPELNYYKDSDSLDKASFLKNTIESKLNNLFDQYPDAILHIHNLNLGKNPVFNLIIKNCVSSGIPLLNHCHDFAEDNRPKNMQWLNKVLIGEFKQDELNDILYPSNSNIHYALINENDRKLLKKHQIPPEDITSLPNAIATPNAPSSSVEKDVRQTLGINNHQPIITYPVRVIERKNIGEFCLIASLFRKEAHFTVTQAPKNDEELPHYQFWKEFSIKHELPITFEAGVKVPFDDLMWSSNKIITTSKKEGFGLSFLEPWLYGKEVVGRDLPEITRDFKSTGIKLENLYTQLLVNDKNFIDYTEIEKSKLIELCLSESDFCKKIITVNHIENLLQPVEEAIINHNQVQILEAYSLESYAKKLNNIYERLAQSN